MSKKPNPQETALNEWRQLVDWMAKARQRERELRDYFVAQNFTNPKEGTNRTVVPDLGVQFVLKHTIRREIEEPVLKSLEKEMLRKGVPVDSLVKWEPSLVLSEYRKLNPAQLKLFNRALVIKPGSPSLEVEPFHPEPK